VQTKFQQDIWNHGWCILEYVIPVLSYHIRILLPVSTLICVWSSACHSASACQISSKLNLPQRSYDIMSILPDGSRFAFAANSRWRRYIYRSSSHLLSVVCLLTPSHDKISLYLVEGFQWNFAQIFIMSVGIAEKVFMVKHAVRQCSDEIHSFVLESFRFLCIYVHMYVVWLL